MNYISVREAAALWNISDRQVQRACIAGRIPGAKKFGNTWAVPENARKPDDLRNPKLKAKAQAGKPLSTPLPLTNAIFPLGDAEAFARALDTPLALAEYHYYRGEAREAATLAQPFLQDADLSLRLSANLIYAFSSLLLHEPENTVQAKAIIEEAFDALSGDTPQEEKALTIFAVSAVCTLLHAPRPPKMPELQYFVNDLRDGVRFFSMMLQAYFAYLNGLYGTSVGIAETVLMLEDTRYPIPSIYLHLMCALCFQYTQYPQQAMPHILAAWEIARKDGLFLPFAQCYPFLGGLLEVTLKKQCPEDFRRITALTGRYLPSWCMVHNALTGDQIPGCLTPSEFTVASLAARGLSNLEIGQHLGIAESTVKNSVSSVRSKLNIGQRKDLAGFMPR